MKYFIISDVHSFYYEMLEALEKAGFDKDNENHTLVVLGDLLDRGPCALNCLKFVNSLDRKILIRGNHEDLIERVLAEKDFRSNDYHNGTVDTIMQLSNTSNTVGACFEASMNEDLRKYLKSVVDFVELKKSIFVHGWIPCITSGYAYYTSGQTFKFDENWRNGNWSEARWFNGMMAWSNGVRVPNKTIYCGHWHCSWGNSKLHNDGEEYPFSMWANSKESSVDTHVNFSPFVDDGIVALDACTALSKSVNCVVIEDDMME